MAPPSQSSTADDGLRFIFKYTLDYAVGGQHAIPDGSLFLTSQTQDDRLVMWWSVPHRAGEPSSWPLRTFCIVPTGGPGYVGKLMHYMGTFQIGGFVGHLMAMEAFDRA